MKIDGVKIEGLNEEIIVIPRGEKQIVLKARAVNDHAEFDKLVPPPKPSVRIMKGGKRVVNVEDPRYLQALNDYAQKRTDWMMLKSLEATEGLEWEKISMSDPNTWHNFEAELRESGFSEIEMMMIVRTIQSANNLDEAKLTKAREDFLASLATQPKESSFQEDEQQDTPSGELVSA